MRRFTIQRLMIAVGLIAGLLGLYRSRGPGAPILAVTLLATSGTVWLAVRTGPRVAPWLFATSTILGDALCLDLSISYDDYVMMFIGFYGTATASIALGSGAAWITAGNLGRWCPRPLAWAVVLGLGLLPPSILVDPWPLRLAFAASKSSMDLLADRVASGRGVTSPEWAGMYRIVASEIDPRNGNVALLTDPNPNGPSGFVRSWDPADRSGPILGTAGFVQLGWLWEYRSED
jgi:hypothetical protein